MTKIDPRELSSRLNTLALASKIYTLEEVGSTNELAFELARNGAPHGTVVIADSQTRGRGRLDRNWVSPKGVNLYISFVLRPGMRLADAPFITFSASIALVEAIGALGVDGAYIKWPNDVLINGKKVAGVLTEAEPDGDNVNFIVLGIGVNINMPRQMIDEELGVEVAPSATSLMEAVGSEVDRTHFAALLIERVESCYGELVNLGTEHIAKEWTARCGMIGKRVEIVNDGEVIKGVARGINPHGYLMVKTDEGVMERVVAGDVVLD